MADEKAVKSDNAEVVGEMLSAIGGVLSELTEAVTGDRDAIQWKVGRMRIVCDGENCGRERPEEHADWLKRDGLDFCPECQRAA